jgi:hypothetical protein
MTTVTAPSLSLETASSFDSLESYEPDGSVADSDENVDDEPEWGIDWSSDSIDWDGETESLDVSKRDPKGGGGGGKGGGGGGRGTRGGKGSGSKRPGGNRGGAPKLHGGYIAHFGGSPKNVPNLLSAAGNWFTEQVIPLFKNADNAIDHWGVVSETPKAGKKAGKQAYYRARAYSRDYVYVVHENFKKVKNDGGKKVLSDLKKHLDAITKFWDKAKWDKYKENDVANVKKNMTAIQSYMDNIRTKVNDSSYGADGNSNVQESGGASISAGKAAGVALFATLWVAGAASARC